MKVIIAIPTYNENNNISILLDRIFSLNSSYAIEVLIIDDNSPDGTANTVKNLILSNEKIHIIERKSKLGLGSAYCQAFRWARVKDYDYLIQMDADLSHNPDDILELLEKAKLNKVIIGSRYKTGVNVVNWPLRRLILSYLANVYARVITGLKVNDLTSGFKCIPVSILKSLNIDRIKSEGYSFQIEINCICNNLGFQIDEVPIIFYDRTNGTSKMSKKIIFEAILRVPIFRLKKIFKLW